MPAYLLPSGGYVNETATATRALPFDGFLHETLVTDFPVTAAGGTYTLTGTAATLTPGGAGLVAAASGSYAVTGTAATFTLEVNIEEPVVIGEETGTTAGDLLPVVILRVGRI